MIELCLSIEKRYAYLLRNIIKIEKYIALYSFFIMVVINIIQIFARYIFLYQFMWVQDITILLASWTIFLGFSVVTYNREDLIVTLIINKLPEIIRSIIRILSLISILAFLVIFSVHGYDLFVVQLGDISAVARVPLSLYTLPLVLASTSMFLIYLHHLLIEVINFNSDNISSFGRSEKL